MLKAGKWQTANTVCEHGLKRFADDLDILGNHTIALRNSELLDAAQESAIKRLNLRRDVHSIEEAVNVLHSQATAKRDINLPDAISLEKITWDLIQEGLSLNPRFYTLCFAEIYARTFAHDKSKVVDLCNAMIKSDHCPLSYRQLAFEKMIETLAEGEFFLDALDMIKRLGNSPPERVVQIKMRILARHFMIGRDSAGQRIIISEVTDYYLKKVAGKSYRSPSIAAEILEWAGERDKAAVLLDNHLSTEPRDWEAIKVMALLRLRAGASTDALKYARMLSQIAPWRAESYDWLSFVGREVKRPDVEEEARSRGNEIFAKEDALFKGLRAYFDK